MNNDVLNFYRRYLNYKKAIFISDPYDTDAAMNNTTIYKEYEKVGLIDFSCDAEGNLGKYVTQKFLEEISLSQKDVIIIELGSMDQVLESVERGKMDAGTVQAIGQKHGLSSVIIGNLVLSEVKPSISLSSIISHMSVKAEVEATMTAKLVDTEHGATVWTASARDRRDVANVSFFPGGTVLFDAKNPEEAYGDLTSSLLHEVTKDLRVSYKRI